MKLNSTSFPKISQGIQAAAVFRIIALCCPVLAMHGLIAQKATSAPSIQSDPNAVAVVTRALTAMGGSANWLAIGAATTELSISRPGTASETIQWTDDWHLGYVLSRRDSSTSNGHRLTIISQENKRFRSSDGGKLETVPPENDLAAIATGYPGAALLLSLNRKGCTFEILNYSGPLSAATSASDKTIEEDCRDPYFSTTAHLIWTFSAATGLPAQVRLPVRLLLRDGVAYETAKFDQFASQGSVLTPSEVTLATPSGQINHLVFSNASFVPSVPNNIFTTP